jgi:hypothetical protein
MQQEEHAVSKDSPGVGVTPRAELKQYKAHNLHTYYKWIAPKLEKEVLALTGKIPYFANQKNQFNEKMFLSDIMQRVQCFQGSTLSPVFARNSCCVSPQKTYGQLRAMQVMRYGYSPAPIQRLHGLHFMSIERGSDFFNIGGVDSGVLCNNSGCDVSSASQVTHTIDFDELGVECELGGMDLDDRVPSFDLQSMPDLRVPQQAVFALQGPARVHRRADNASSYCDALVSDNNDQPIQEADSERIKCEEAFRRAWSKNNEEATAWSKNNQWDYYDAMGPPLLPCSRGLTETILDERYTVPKMLSLSVMAAVADMSMLSLVIVLDTLSEVHMTTRFLREHIRFKDRGALVCEFLVGSFYDDGFTKSRLYVEQCERQTRLDLQKTIKSRGIVVSLRRSDVLTNLNHELAGIKANNVEAPGSSICYTEDVKNFNRNISLLVVVHKLTKIKEIVLREYVKIKTGSAAKTETTSSTSAGVVTSTTTSCTTASSPSLTSLSKHTKSTIVKRKPPGRKFCKPLLSSRKVVRCTNATTATTTTPTTAIESEETIETGTWESWEHTDINIDRPGPEQSIWWRPRVQYYPSPAQELTVADVHGVKAEVDASIEWCERYRQILALERDRLLEVKLPNCVGILLAMESKDDDDDATKACINALSGTSDTGGVMIPPHCTVLLSHTQLQITQLS